MGSIRLYDSLHFPITTKNEVTQSCPTLCDPMDSSPPGSSIQGFSRQDYWGGDVMTWGGGQEDQPHAQGAVAVQAQEDLEELSHIEGPEGWQ